jgi:flagellar export protein FliJ
MKAISTLIKLARAEVDGCQRALAEAQRLHARALTRIADLDVRIADEQAVAAKAASAWSTYGGYAAARAEDRRVLHAEAAEYAAHEASLREKLAQAHVELKKLEMLAELEAARAREAEARAELAALDEAATIRAARERL